MIGESHQCRLPLATTAWRSIISLSPRDRPEQQRQFFRFINSLRLIVNCAKKHSVKLADDTFAFRPKPRIRAEIRQPRDVRGRGEKEQREGEEVGDVEGDASVSSSGVRTWSR